MHDQLLQVAEMSKGPRITVQVVPAEVGAHVGLLGSFITASFADGTPGMVYLETPVEGETSKNPGTRCPKRAAERRRDAMTAFRDRVAVRWQRPHARALGCWQADDTARTVVDHSLEIQRGVEADIPFLEMRLSLYQAMA
jgi:hypothetical protein